MEDKKIYILVGVAIFAYILIRMVFNRLIRLKKLKKDRYALNIACYEYMTLYKLLKRLNFRNAYMSLDSGNFQISDNGDRDCFECQFGTLVCTIYRDSERQIKEVGFETTEDGCRLSEFVDIYDSAFCENYSHKDFNISKYIKRQNKYAGEIPFREYPYRL